VSWSIDGRNTEDLTLTLERDMTRAARGSFAKYVIPRIPTDQRVSAGGSSSNTSTSGGGRNGLPTDGKWDGYADWGDQAAGTIDNTKAVPLQNLLRISGVPDGFTPNIDSQFNIGVGNMAGNLVNQLKGAMEFNTDSMTGGNFSVLGQKKPSAAPRNRDGAYGLTMSPSDGDAVSDENGISFSGAADNTSAYSSFSTNVPIPAAVASSQIQISGISTMDAASGAAVLYITVSTLQGGILVSKEVTVSQTVNGQISLFNDTVVGADNNNDTLKITIARQAGVGSDTAQYAGVTIHNLQVEFDTRSVSGASESGNLSF